MLTVFEFIEQENRIKIILNYFTPTNISIKNSINFPIIYKIIYVYKFVYNTVGINKQIPHHRLYIFRC